MSTIGNNLVTVGRFTMFDSPNTGTTPTPSANSSSSSTNGLERKQLRVITDDTGTKYECGKILGQGTYGSVLDVETGSPKVAKFNKPEYKFYVPAVTEARALQDAKHPHVVGFRKSFATGTPHELAIILDKLDTPNTFETFTKTRTPLTSYETISFGKQMLEWLSPFHAQGYMHRDIKSQNVMYNRDLNQVKGFDFGAVAKVGNDYHDVQALAYRAPEVLKKEKYDTKIDIWGLGCLLFEMYTGEQFITQVYAKLEEYSSAIDFQFTSVPTRFGTHPLWQQIIYKKATERGESLASAFSVVCLISRMLERNPAARISAQDALALPELAADINIHINAGFEGTEYHLHIFDGNEHPIPESDIGSTADPLLCRNLGNPNVYKDQCIHMPSSKSKRYVVEVVDGQDSLKGISKPIEWKNGKTLNVKLDPESGAVSID